MGVVGARVSMGKIEVGRRIIFPDYVTLASHLKSKYLYA
jgi:hypothetical protein